MRKYTGFFCLGKAICKRGIDPLQILDSCVGYLLLVVSVTISFIFILSEDFNGLQIGVLRRKHG